MKKIAVVGDSILDKYSFYKSSRLSPEAPVPVVNKYDSNYSIGGAGLVARKLLELNNYVDLYTQIGGGSYGNTFLSLSKGIEIFDFAKQNFTITFKDRFIVNDKYFLRKDEDSFDRPDINTILKKIEMNIKDYNACVMTDYNKGFFSEELYQEIIKICQSNDVPTFFDPNINNKFNFEDIDFIKLNLDEALIISSEEVEYEMLEYFMNKGINPIITKSSQGAISLMKDTYISIDAPDIEAVDVSGCGDIFFSVFVNYFIESQDIKESMTHAVGQATEYVKYFGYK